MKDKSTAGVLAILLGGIGVHKFYLGSMGLGVLYVAFCWTGIPAIAGLIEGIMYLTMDQQSFDMRYNQLAFPMQMYTPMLQAPPPPPQNIVVNVAQTGAQAGGDVATQLKALHELKLAGALTEDEFAAQKKKLLGG